MSENAPSLETSPTLESVKAAYEAKKAEFVEEMRKWSRGAGLMVDLELALTNVRTESRAEEKEREGREASMEELEKDEQRRMVVDELASKAERTRLANAKYIFAADRAMVEMNEQKERYVRLGGNPKDVPEP